MYSPCNSLRVAGSSSSYLYTNSTFNDQCFNYYDDNGVSWDNVLAFIMKQFFFFSLPVIGSVEVNLTTDRIDSSGAFRGGRTTVDRQAAETLGFCLSGEVGLKRQNLDQKPLVSFCRTSMDVLLDTCTGRRAVRCLLRCLLLLHLFSMKAAADCPKPQEGANIVLTNAALLLNAFPEGLEVTLECGHGFVKESGSEIITCLHGIWTELALKCKKKDCGDPKPQPHMSFNISSGTLFGDTIKVICDKGFEISGSAYRTCYANGWSGRGTTCEIVTCNKPVNVINGKSSWDSQEYPTYGEIIQYFCNTGYVLIGNDILACSDTGEYDSQPPTCEGQTREDLRITATMATPTPPPQGQTTEDLRITTTMATPTPPPQGQTIEDLRITTTMATPTPPPQEAPTSTDSPATPTPTAHRDTSVTTSVTPTVSPSLPGGRGIWTVEGTATTTSVTSMTSSSFPGEYDEALDTNKGIGYSLVIVGLIAAIFVLLVAGIALWKFILRRKGSYDTREDLKPELLQFQNL